MRRVFDHIERVKEKPHHVRRGIAFGSAGLIAAVIGLTWFSVSFSSGAFAIQGSSFADATQGSDTVTTQGSQDTSLLGAAAAADAESGPARIEVVNAATSSTATSAPSDKRVIPF